MIEPASLLLGYFGMYSGRNGLWLLLTGGVYGVSRRTFRMTLSGYFVSKSVFGQHFLSQRVWLSKIIARKLTKIHAISGRNVAQ